MGRYTAYTLGLVLVAIITSTDVRSNSPQPPSRGFPFELEKGKLYHGVFPGNEERPELFNPAYLGNYTDVIDPGRKLAWVYFSNEWDNDPAFPKWACDEIRQHGATPYLRLMLRKDPYAPKDKVSERQRRSGRLASRMSAEPSRNSKWEFSYAGIERGDFDDALLAWGKAAAEWKYPLIVEWGTECNGDWFWWGGAKNGGAKGVQQFKSAYLRIIDKIKEGGGGASNIVWVLHLNVESSPNEEWNQPEKYFPDGSDIQWAGVSIYGDNEKPFGAPKHPFTKRFACCYDRINMVRPQIPVVIAELGTTKTRDNADLVWTKEALAAVSSGKWPNVFGFAWWNDAYQAYDENLKVSRGLVTFRVEGNDRLAGLLRDFIKQPHVWSRPKD